jgi:dGTPase
MTQHRPVNALMSWPGLLSNQRLHRTDSRSKEVTDSTGRSTFLSDVDRITFSASFRRLARKTQVFPLAANDHVHNRLTHSLEVSRVGRTLGTAIGQRILNDARYTSELPVADRSPMDFGAIVEAASLAHDIGHPPFGHAGDRAVQHWFEHSDVANEVRRAVSKQQFDDLRHFDGNAQGFRRITQLEKNVFTGGLNLTYSTLAAYIKYPIWPGADSSKTGFFRSEKEIVEAVSRGVGLIKRKGGYCRYPLSFLVEAADDVCYGFLDLEDAVEMNILTLHDVADLLLRSLPAKERKAYQPSKGERSHRVVFARMRGKIFRQAIMSAVKTFFLNYDAIMTGDFEKELLAEAARRGESAVHVVLEAKDLAKQQVFLFDHKVSVELGCYAVMARLLDEFVVAALSFAKAFRNDKSKPILDSKSEMLLAMLGDNRPRRGNAPNGDAWTAYQCVRRNIDFISGMTDDFAIRLNRQLSGQIALRT